MKLNKNFITYKMDNEQVLVSNGAKDFSGIVHSNDTASFIVDCLKEDTTKEIIVDKMANTYDAPKETIAIDVDKIIDKLRKIGAIDE